MKLRIMIALYILAFILLTSCSSENASDISNSTSNSKTETAVSDISETAGEIADYKLPENDYGGFEFRILARDNDWDKMEVDFDEPQSDPIYDAVYKRNLAVEELYNVKIIGHPHKIFLN